MCFSSPLCPILFGRQEFERLKAQADPFFGISISIKPSDATGVREGSSREKGARQGVGEERTASQRE